MNEQEAMQLLTSVCAGYQGNLKDHQAIQQALSIIRNKAFPAPIKEVVEEEKEIVAE